MEKFAEVVQRYAPLRKGHITTRQNFQFHHVPLRDAAAFIREISSVGLSSREGCGNTVRNVTSDPWAGVCENEVFDPTPYTGAYVRYFVRHPETQLMPRKVKTAFDGAPEERAIAEIHDIAYRAKIKDGKRGFEMLVGGGTSIMPRTAQILYDFVDADSGEYLEAAEAVFRIFNRQDWLRANRMRARIKVFVDKYGIDELRRQVDQERQGDWVSERDFDVEKLRFDDDEEAVVTKLPMLADYAQPKGDRSEYERWTEDNVKPQRQKGFSTVQVNIIRGDLSPEQFRGLAQIMRDFCGGYARTTVSQNLVLRWVRDEAIYSVWHRLGEIGLANPGADTVIDTVSCPGTDSCKLGITSSMGLNRAIHDRVEQMNITDPLTKKIHIKMSGCPNGCGQHHIGNIGFYGASIKLGDKTIPAYVAHIGGRFECEAGVVFGQRLKIRLPAKRVPDAVERWIRFYEAERLDDDETFNAFTERIGLAAFEERAKDISIPVEFNLENIDHFIDWSRREPYEVVRGEGECAV
jgi:sulfite reductase (ferredoxin)